MADPFVSIAAGSFVPAFARQRVGSDASVPARKVDVAAFRIDRYPVTNAQFLAFLVANPQWRKSNIKAIFADGHYLDRWPTDLVWAKSQSPNQPVTSVSWFAAQAYCESEGSALPTTDQWEYALWDEGRHQNEVKAAQLAWFGTPGSAFPEIDSLAPNGLGIHGLVGAVWELTLDVEGVPTGSDARSGSDTKLFCGGASVGAKDPSDYAAFMRYSFRSCIKASYTTKDLGFRCAGREP